ncbi:hypothetical protein V2J09_009160 [Rumex salicifolius]
MKLCDRLDSGKPKLTLTTLPSSHRKTAAEPLGLITPPLNPMASVPFQWEEVPGRPRIRPNKTLSPGPSPSPISKPKSARFLDVPPRLMTLVDGKVNDLPSPTTVLGGLELEDLCTGGSASASASARKERRGGRGMSSAGCKDCSPSGREVVLSCNATADHAIIWIERESQKALNLPHPLTNQISSSPWRQIVRP